MPFGLWNATQTFQRSMDTIFREFDFVYCYIDDIIIMSGSPEQHREHLRIVLSRLQQHRLSINISKYCFVQSHVQYLGYTIKKDDYKLPTERVEAIINYKKKNPCWSSTLPGHPKLLPQMHTTRSPTSSSSQRTSSWSGEERQTEGLVDPSIWELQNQPCRSSLASDPYPNPPFVFVTDASDAAIGASLVQKCDGHWKPLGFFSRKLTSTKTRYCTCDR
jgi:cleavage and polyadenylation specificity factor subunit 1